MSRPATSRADLVRAFAHLADQEMQAAALAAGFEPDPNLAKSKSGDQGANATDSTPATPKAETPPPYQPSDLPDLPFWCIARIAELPPPADGAPEWLSATPAWQTLPLSDPNCPRPVQQELVGRAAQARFLKRELVQQKPGPGLDAARLCAQLAARRLPARLPRPVVARWPGRLDVLLDFCLPLRPYWDDFWQLAATLQRLLGARVVLWRLADGDPASAQPLAGHAPQGPRPRGGALLVLSDAGMYAPASARARRWERYGREQSDAGVLPLLVAPLPRRRVEPQIARWFSLVCWERGARLAPLRHSRGLAAGAGTAAETLPAGTLALFGALANSSRVEPPLLRLLRLALAEYGSDVGSEYEVWNDARVHSNILACAPAPDHRAAASEQFARLPWAVRRQIAELREAGNRHQSPLIRGEEAIADGDLASPAAWRAAQDLAKQLSATLYAPSAPGRPGELAAYVSHLAERRPELLQRSRHYATAWAIARRDEILAGSLKAPRGVDMDAVRWLLPPDRGATPAFLGRIGNTLGLFARDRSQPECRIAEVEVDGAYMQVEVLPSGAGAPAEDQPAQVLGLGKTFVLAPEYRYRLRCGHTCLELEAISRPAWAAGLGQDREGLYAELADGRKLYWVPAQTFFAQTGPAPDQRLPFSSQPVAPPGMPAREPTGFWWDAAEYRAWREEGCVFRKPDWAVASGVDEYGWWAEFQVKSVRQRMRWIPPGEFLMGSPQNEPERHRRDEPQHLVLLSRAFWLADTACTQALWRAVLGDSPARFVGDDLPVEQVSWDDVSVRFTGELNRLVFDLDGRVPTEAQWEYACRAGTETAFWFGANITTAEVNYDANYPYPGGIKGEYRGCTLPVSAMPRNGWGLYQMHGNVFEWCLDWHGPILRGPSVDPLADSGEPARVLRGGSWSVDARFCRSAVRIRGGPIERNVAFGFRLSRAFFCADASGAASEIGAPAPKRSDAPGGRATNLKPHGKKHDET